MAEARRVSLGVWHPFAEMNLYIYIHTHIYIYTHSIYTCLFIFFSLVLEGIYHCWWASAHGR